MTVQEGRLGRRLHRILLMLPYAIKHPGITVQELSERFAVDADDLLADLHLVFMCGLPGYGPGDLIDVSIDDDDRVYVTMADYFAAPLRLTPSEALTLYAGGAAIASLPEMSDADALKRALDKLGDALGLKDSGLEVRMEGGTQDHLMAIKRALEDEKRLNIEYLSATSGSLSEREIDPWGIVGALGRWYLIGFDHSVGDERMFRIDRIKRIENLGSSAEIPDDFDPDRYRGAFVDKDSLPTVTFDVSPEVAAWFPDYYPTRSTTVLDDGWMRIEMASSGPRWSAMLLVRLGAAVRDVSPPELLTEAKKVAASIYRLYD